MGNFLFLVVVTNAINSHQKFPSSCVHLERNRVETEKYKVRMNITLPERITQRNEFVHQIRNNPKIVEFKFELSKLMPGLTCYIARELKGYTHNKVGGPADILVFPKTLNEVTTVLRFARDKEIPFTVLGKGSNVIIRDGGVRGITIMTRELRYFKLTDKEFTVGAGSGLDEAAYYLLEHCKSNFEWAVGIPGSIGGAVYMNAGTFGVNTEHCLKSVKFVDSDGKIKTFRVRELKFRNRYSIFHENCKWFILEATFNVKSGNITKMDKKMQDIIQLRENHFPLEYPQHGCTFKKPSNAVQLIKKAGLPGTKIGGVMISRKHPNFFINVGQGTAADYEELIVYATTKVLKFSGLLLELEVEFIGECTVLAVASQYSPKSKVFKKTLRKLKSKKK